MCGTITGSALRAVLHKVMDVSLLVPLSRRFYSRSAPDVAEGLLGRILVRRDGSALLAGRIVEVEAYLGEEDPASHAYRGPTPRNAPMFGPAGTAYVYFSYGNHHCLNIVTGRVDEAGAVLIRAVEPVSGLKVMRSRRASAKRDVDLTSGPGKLCQAFGIDLSLNGVSMLKRDFFISSRRFLRKGERIERSSRIGISQGREFDFRFYIAGSPYVSRKKP